MSTQVITHVWLDDSAVAWIDDTKVKVIEVVVEHLAHGWSPEEIHFQHPELSLAQIHAALGHYHDHRAAFDALIERQLAELDDLRSQAGDTPFRSRLRGAGPPP